MDVFILKYHCPGPALKALHFSIYSAFIGLFPRNDCSILEFINSRFRRHKTVNSNEKVVSNDNINYVLLAFITFSRSATTPSKTSRREISIAVPKLTL